MRHGLVQIGIERLPERFHGRESLGLEDRPELALDEPHALDPRGAPEVVRDRGERAVVAVEHVEQLRDEVGLRELRELRALRLVALAVIREVGGEALEIVRELGLSIFSRCPRWFLGPRWFGIRLVRGHLTLARPVLPAALALLEQLFRSAHLIVHQ